MDSFKLCEGDAFMDIRSDMKTIQEKLQDAYGSAKALSERLKEGEWEGEAREAMTAFMDLMLQYHASFIGSPNDPVQEAVDGINACVEALGNFYTDSDAYLELEKM